MRIRNIRFSIIKIVILCAGIMLAMSACIDGSPSNNDDTIGYVCENGTAANGTAESANITKCTDCDSGYVLDEEACRLPRYVCQNGKPVTGSANTDGENNCQSCDPYFKLENSSCRPTVYTCNVPNGTPADGSPQSDQHEITKEDVNKCSGVTVTVQASLNGSSSDSTVPISITSLVDATLWWVVFSDGTFIDDADAIIRDNNSKGGVARSGETGIQINAGVPHNFSVTGLKTSTEYHFYAAIQQDSNNETFLSEKLDIRTVSENFPYFEMQPVATDADIEQTTAEITLSSNIDATLYWVVYASAQSALTPEQLKADATGIVNGVIRSGGGNTVSAGITTTVELMSLQPNQPYYFYAALEHNNNRVLSSLLPFTTAPLPSFVMQPVAADADIEQTTAEITLSSNIDATLYWVVYASEQNGLTAGQLVTDATDMTAGVIRSGGGNTVSAGITTTVELMSLQPNQPYYFYATLKDNDHQQLSEELPFTTAPLPSFVMQPVAADADIEQTTAEIALSSNIDATLYWVVYASEQNGLTAGQLVTDATDMTAGVIRSGGGNTVSAGNTVTVEVMSLQPNQPYYFYAVLKDNDHQQLSEELPFTTAPLPSFVMQPVATDADIELTSAKVTLSSNIDATLYWVVYASEQSGLKAGQLVTDATDVPAGVISSGSENTVSAGNTVTVEVMSLQPNQPYYFYAVLEYNDYQQLSEGLPFTSDGYPFVCTGGVEADGANDTEGLMKCKECSLNYTMSGDTCIPDGDNDSIPDSEDIDEDNDGLIEISTLTELYNMRYNLAGTSYDDEEDDGAGNEGNSTGAPAMTNQADDYVCGASASGTCGYELTTDLSFDADGDGSTWTESGGSYTLDSDDDKDSYFDVDSGGWLPIGDTSDYFDAFFEGNNNTITGLAISGSDNHLGLFGAVANGNTVQNLTITNSLVVYTGNDDSSQSGIVVGTLGDADSTDAAITIDNVRVTGTSVVVGDAAVNTFGGIAGLAHAANIANSSSSVDVLGGDGIDTIGGLVGRLANGSITDSFATGDINGQNNMSASVTDGENVGGLVGQLQNDATITASYASGAIAGGDGNYDFVGGLVGYMTGTSAINGGYATGAVDGGNGDWDLAGGMIGYINGTVTITDSYATGMVSDSGSNSFVGGFAGFNRSGHISSSHATGNVSTGDGDNVSVGGLIGSMNQGSVTGSYATTGTVRGGNGESNDIGGLVGILENATITASYATGYVYGGTNNTDEVIGGLVGSASNFGRIVASYAMGDVDSGSGTNEITGGLVGFLQGTVIASYASGNVRTSDNNANISAGGLVGYNNGTITASYASGGSISGGDGNDTIGGLVGGYENGSITSSFAIGNITGGAGSDTGGAIAGEQGSDVNTNAAYGFGAIGDDVENPSGSSPLDNAAVDANDDGSIDASDIPSNANGLTSSHFTGTEAGNAWTFPTGESPKLLYTDYDGEGTTYSCTNVTVSVGGSDVELTCGTSEVPGQ